MRHYDSSNAEVLTLAFSQNTAADHTLVAAVTGQKVVVLSYVLVAAGSVNITWKSNTTALSGAMPMITGTPQGLASERYGVLRTTTGQALVLALSGGVAVTGFINYILEDQVDGR